MEVEAGAGVVAVWAVACAAALGVAECAGEFVEGESDEGVEEGVEEEAGEEGDEGEFGEVGDNPLAARGRNGITLAFGIFAQEREAHGAEGEAEAEVFDCVGWAALGNGV